MINASTIHGGTGIVKESPRELKKGARRETVRVGLAR